MNCINQAWRRISSLNPLRGVIGLLLAIVFTVMPTFALAGEGNVKLEFQGNDVWYLWISLGFAFIALVTAAIISVSTMKVDPGSDKMVAVSQAIKEGAIAYLKRQIMTMVWFIIVLAIGLFFLYQSQYGTYLGIAIAGSFVLGVAASYIAGLTGMIMAVNGNTRTAAAALTSYKKALETAFRSGSVAGMVTVGLGLLGATLIFMFFKADAMKLLVGFGFGGSLAALFMRVGGGIFTKAADVGADLVGKVEAGIPEDDPRNPATIADNVGDNVGDCAGMAADVFESYEVTLVAAIILGAATASIFDQTTWMKLILFALMARGVGIIASIVGIACVRGSDDVNTDPLFPIRRGFWVSAAIAAIATLGLGYFMMGGGKGEKIISTQLASEYKIIKSQIEELQTIRKDIAAKRKVDVKKVTEKDVLDDPRAKKYGLTAMDDRALKTYLNVDLKDIPEAKNYSGYSKLTKDSKQDISIIIQTEAGTPEAVKLGADIENMKWKFYELESQGTVQRVLFRDSKKFEEQISKNPDSKTTVKASYNISAYANADGDVLYGIEGNPPSIDNPMMMIPTSYFKMSDVEVNKLLKTQSEKASLDKLNETSSPKIAFVSTKPVDWWRFPLCIVFGILMAFVIEFLTDYYVSLHKKPVQEVAGTSTTGPATMIISGFAYGMESSVFSVFAIVLALMAPMIIFPPTEFGGYILSFYGIALVGLGLLTTTGFILAMDTFGPISDNAQGVYEMSGVGEDNEAGSKAVQRLDAAGNTTKALTKGFAIATAVVAAVALFHSYLEEAQLTAVGLRLEIPEIFLGMLIGGAAPYLFSAFSINAVGRAAFKLINEVRDQFRNDPGIMAGTSKPNYGRCVAIVTQAAQQELLGPGILAIALPAAVAFGFSIGKPTVGGLNLCGAQALGGYLAGAILSGQLMAVLLSNAGGIWDNAKKYIEDGAYGGKGSDAHKAGVVCDTVGDPFKDTAGPALNPLIKVMNLVALLLAPVVIKPISNTYLVIITLVCVAALAFSVYWSKRGSMSSELAASNAKNDAE